MPRSCRTDLLQRYTYLCQLRVERRATFTPIGHEAIGKSAVFPRPRLGRRGCRARVCNPGRDGVSDVHGHVLSRPPLTGDEALRPGESGRAVSTADSPMQLTATRAHAQAAGAAGLLPALQPSTTNRQLRLRQAPFTDRSAVRTCGPGTIRHRGRTFARTTSPLPPPGRGRSGPAPGGGGSPRSPTCRSGGPSPRRPLRRRLLPRLSRTPLRWRSPGWGFAPCW